MQGQARAAALTLMVQHQLKNVVPNHVFLSTLIGRCWLCSSYLFSGEGEIVLLFWCKEI